ncbi:MAG: hypothetical protein DHS20C13_07160 [Thermodesulfobacteriota bacterium]|nr:MAG: hypothetical protein DHS20C13_07160 [Thermodesulfobacteriota bacterium]
MEKDEETGEKRIDALGPFISYDKKAQERGYGLRPIFYKYEDIRKDRNSFDFIYPLSTYRTFEGDTKFQALMYIFYYKSDLQENGYREREYTLFPFVFARHAEDPDRSFFAVFPVYGNMKNKYGKDRIKFFLFPLFLQTENYGVKNSNFIWPFIGYYSGNGASGGRLWPVYGQKTVGDSVKDEFALWPIYMKRYREFYGSEINSLAILPFYYGLDMPGRKQRTYGWPFFTYIENTNRNFKRYDMPWPIVTFSRGDVNTNRIFPLFSVKKEEDFESGYALWPLYSWRSHKLDDYEIKKRAIAYFLYKDVQNIPRVEGGRDSRAINLWPLFTYRRLPDGRAYFNFISPLETFLQDNAPRERNWRPLWTLFRWDRDEEGNHVSSFLWNTFRTESTKKGVKVDLRPIIPVISYENTEEKDKFHILGGLFGYSKDKENNKKTLKFLFIPVNIS